MKRINYLLLTMVFCILTGCSEDTLETSAVGKITGMVIEKGTNEPIENIKISTNPATSTVFTDENGAFILVDVPPDDYSVQAMKEGLLTQFEGATVLAEAEVNVIFEMVQENTANNPPTSPVAIQPEDGAVDLGQTVEFAWDATDPENDSLTFSLEIRNSSTNEVLKFTEIPDSTYTVQGLEYNQKYFWQVAVSDEFNGPIMSPIFSFETLDYPNNGRFLFVRTINGNNVIFSSDENGDELQLTSEAMNSFRPRKSNAVDKIAFLRTIGAQTHLFTMNFNGSQQFQVTNTIPVNGFNLKRIDFSWSENGAKLVYPNFSKLYEIQINGGGNTLIYQTTDGKFITEVDVSDDNTLMALITNNADGYESTIFTVDMNGNLLTTVLSNVNGAVGGINLSANNQKLLYSHDVSGFESPQYRQLNSQLFIYDFPTAAATNISDDKPNGTNDQDPRFSPNESEVLFTNISNDGFSPPAIFKTDTFNNSSENRVLLFDGSSMPDWE